MYPTYWENEEVKVIAHAPFERWAVIGFHPPDNENELYLKRIVGLPGEHIAYREGQLYINGKKSGILSEQTLQILIFLKLLDLKQFQRGVILFWATIETIQ